MTLSSDVLARHRVGGRKTLYCLECPVDRNGWMPLWPCLPVQLARQLDEAEVREGELRAALAAINPGLIADRVLQLIKEATEARDAALAKGKP